MKRISSLTFLLLVLTVQGCATLSKSECRKADWQIIGLEDGSAGRPVSYISRHRKSCAEHGVKPDLDQYQRGHADGIVLFCTPRKAFELGNAGRSHQDVCPVDLRDAFRAAYADGQEVYAARKALNEAKNQVKSAQAELEAVSEDIVSLEAELVSGGGTAEQRQGWLDETKRLQREQEQLQESLHDLEHEVTALQSEYEYLSSRFEY